MNFIVRLLKKLEKVKIA